MACASYGALIMEVLKEKKCPVTYREILEEVAFKLKVAKMHIKGSVDVALRIGVNKGHILKTGHRFYLMKSVKKTTKIRKCPKKLVDRIKKCRQDTSLLDKKYDFEVLTYSDDEEAMVFNYVNQEKSSRKQKTILRCHNPVFNPKC